VEERHFNWGYLSLFVACLLIIALAKQWNGWRERSKRKARRGFRNMKSSAQIRREPSKKGNWRR
jgi:Flp pilus assembly protein TadB